MAVRGAKIVDNAVCFKTDAWGILVEWNGTVLRLDWRVVGAAKGIEAPAIVSALRLMLGTKIKTDI